MREIKFRAFDIKSKFYKYPELWDSSMPSNWNKHYVLEQFTGLKDKNGKEIYEGDILPISFEIDKNGAITYTAYGIINGFVEWDKNQLRWIVKFPPSDKYNVISCEFGWGGFREWQVIGNVHENPELLK